MTVLEHLHRAPSSGYAIVKAINEQTGWKPSFGSMYPLLERLESEGLVTVKEEGRSKVYHLTTSGNKVSKEERETRNRAHRTIIEQLTVLASMGDEHARDAADMLRRAEKTGTFPDTPEIIEMRQEVFRIFREGLDKTHRAELKAVATKATKEFKKIVAQK